MSADLAYLLASLCVHCSDPLDTTPAEPTVASRVIDGFAHEACETDAIRYGEGE